MDSLRSAWQHSDVFTLHPFSTRTFPLACSPPRLWWRCIKQLCRKEGQAANMKPRRWRFCLGCLYPQYPMLQSTSCTAHLPCQFQTSSLLCCGLCGQRASGKLSLGVCQSRSWKSNPIPFLPRQSISYDVTGIIPDSLATSYLAIKRCYRIDFV